MRLALFGDGRMGRAVRTLAEEGGWEVGAVVTDRDAGLGPEELARLVRGHDAAIDFSIAEAVVGHVAACVRARVPLVQGTTGWQEREAEVRRLVADGDGALLFGANFSIGVQVLYRLVDRAAELLGGVPGYDVFIEEAHHAAKRDAPSGTALELRRLVRGRLGRDVGIASTRAGQIAGEHRVGFESAADSIMLIHSAHSRAGFAAGALAAARWLCGRRGVYQFGDAFEDILASERRSP